MERAAHDPARRGDDSRRRSTEASGARPLPAAIALVIAVVLGIATALSPAANLLLLIGCVLAFGAGVGLIFDPPLRNSQPKDRVALRVLLGLTAGGALTVVLLPVLSRTGLW